MTDIRSQLPECPLAYQIPDIPGSHTALGIDINAGDIDWQAKMLPWTLASLINNTDIVMKGVHLYIVCEDGDAQERIKTALKKFDFRPRHIITPKDGDSNPLTLLGKHGYAYDSVCLLDIHYWAFRGIGKCQDAALKLPLGHVLRHTWGWAVADYRLKNTWGRMSEPSRWLHDANRAVYGDAYKAENKNVAAYFFNETEANWYLDPSILQYSTRDVNAPHFTQWAETWKHLGTQTLIALWLLKTGQHAYNLQNSVRIHPSYSRAEYPRLCNMRKADRRAFRSAIEALLGAQLNIAP